MYDDDCDDDKENTLLFYSDGVSVSVLYPSYALSYRIATLRYTY